MNHVAHPTNLAFGNTDATKLYATIKNGAVYVFNTSIPEGRGPALVAKIYAAGKIALKNWTRVRNAPTKAAVKKVDTRTITTEQRLPYGQYWKQRALAAENALKAARLEQPESEWEFETEMQLANKMWEFEKSGDTAGAVAYLNARNAKLMGEKKVTPRQVWRDMLAIQHKSSMEQKS